MQSCARTHKHTHVSVCSAAIQRNLEHSVVSGHPLRGAGVIAGSNQKGSGQRGVREGSRYSEHKVAVRCAFWKLDTKSYRHSYVKYQKGHGSLWEINMWALGP